MISITTIQQILKYLNYSFRGTIEDRAPMPPNYFDVSLSKRNNYIHTFKVRDAHLQLNYMTVDTYNIFTTMETRRDRTTDLGGNITIKMRDDPTRQTLQQVKIYGLHYHLLRPINKDTAKTPMTTRQLDRNYRRLSDIQRQMTANEQLVGGIRIEAGFRPTTIQSALDKYMQQRPDNIDMHLRRAHVDVHRMTVQDYLQARETFENARRRLQRDGVFRRQRNTTAATTQQKRLMGDLKLTLGYNHTGYRTSTRGRRAWWGNDNNDDNEQLDMDFDEQLLNDIDNGLLPDLHPHSKTNLPHRNTTTY